MFNERKQEKTTCCFKISNTEPLPLTFNIYSLKNSRIWLLFKMTDSGTKNTFFPEKKKKKKVSLSQTPSPQPTGASHPEVIGSYPCCPFHRLLPGLFCGHTPPCSYTFVSFLGCDYFDKRWHRPYSCPDCPSSEHKGSSHLSHSCGWTIGLFLLLKKKKLFGYQFSSVAQSCPTLRLHESQHASPACPSPTPGVHPNSCSWSR